MFYLLLVFSKVYVEHPLGRGVVFKEGEVTTDNSAKNNRFVRSARLAQAKNKIQDIGLVTGPDFLRESRIQRVETKGVVGGD